MQKNYWILLVFLLIPHAATAQTGNCKPALAEAYLDAGNVRARILNNGALFGPGGATKYEVPKGADRNAIYTASIWLGGLINNELHIAATRIGPAEFWAGPLDENGNPPADCKQYDKIWQITRADLQTYIESGQVSHALQNWPWQLGAPVIDGDGIPGNYNLAGGDLPELLGDQRLWWIMNDRGNAHEATDSKPIGLEVRSSAHAFAQAGPVSNITFYQYEVVNKNVAAVEDAFFGVFIDGDLGNFGDDFIGSDSLLHLAYIYNSDNEDEGIAGYGLAPPAIGLTFLESIPAENDNLDNDRDGTIDEPGENLGAFGMMQYWDSGYTRAFKGIDYYRYMLSRWKDNRPIYHGLTGFSWAEQADYAYLPLETTRFYYPGDPVDRSFWSEMNYDDRGSMLRPYDRMSVVSSGPFSIPSQDTIEVRFAIVWSRGNSHLDSVTELKKDVRAVRDLSAYFYNPQTFEPEQSPAQNTALGFDQNFPNPFSHTTALRYSLPQTMQVRLAVYDLLGREVALLVNAQQEAGIYTTEFDAGNLPAGVYLARIELDFLQFTKRMVLR